MHVLWALILTGCGGGDGPAEDVGEKDAPVAAVEELTPPAQAPMPEPLMRKALMCCADLAMEPVMAAYLSLGKSLATGDSPGIEGSLADMKRGLERVADPGEHLVKVAAHLKQLSSTDLAVARDLYGKVSDLLIGKLEPSASGELDLAVAYSREADHHWLQEGVEPRSPYGDGIHSYSWGTREEVQAADSDREKELANPVP